MGLTKKIFDDFMVLVGLVPFDDITTTDRIRHAQFVKYCTKKGLDYNLTCSELKETDKAYMRYC